MHTADDGGIAALTHRITCVRMSSLDSNAWILSQKHLEQLPTGGTLTCLQQRSLHESQDPTKARARLTTECSSCLIGILKESSVIAVLHLRVCAPPPSQPLPKLGTGFHVSERAARPET